MQHAKFVVLTSSRTGSTWLMDRLNGLSGVNAHGELFLGHARRKPALAGRADFERFVALHPQSGIARIPSVILYLNRLYRSSPTVGFKLMYTQLRNFPEILPYLAVRRIRIIHLVRRNGIDILISEELARVTGVSHMAIRTPVAAQRVHLDPSNLVHRLHRLGIQVKNAERIVRLSTCRNLKIEYEALLNGDQEFRRILAFLAIDVAVTGAPSILEKRGALTHQEAILNYDEIRNVLRATPFSSMLR